MKTSRRIAYAAAAIAAAAVAWWALQPAPRPLDVVRVQRGELVQRFEEEGRTELARHWVVAAPIAGTLRRIALLQGDPVKAGQELAQIEPLRAQLLDPANRARLLAEERAAQAAMQAARQRQAAAQADAGLAARDVARMRKLGAAGAISLSALDAAEAQVSRAGRGIRACPRRCCAGTVKARQLAFLRQNGIRHYLDVYGWPVVTRAAVEGVMEAPAPPVWRSNKARDLV